MKKDNRNLYINTAEYYDYDNRDNLTADIPFYIDFAHKIGKKVLELGCGTGRVTIPLALSGCMVTGLDLSESMLRVFREKLEKQQEPIKKRVALVKGDMSNFSITQKFDLIIVPFRAFQGLTEDNEI